MTHVSLPDFLYRTNLKLHNISITPKLVKNIITKFDLSKACGLDCIPVVLLRDCEPELQYISTGITIVYTSPLPAPT